ncbi:MAG: putative transmembrane protein [uncultured Propionibacteriaceae bacterium]|uniref:Putative transmembrane protein n=1 Tax=uncultured Propionibacteriaceae bacterium TaxID=257457 RepID=A0A6J4PP82_9ACTN|nr:MAG: putative transmembrane protein [uncultured Propionibacteriaceae bacterium]
MRRRATGAPLTTAGERWAFLVTAVLVLAVVLLVRQALQAPPESPQCPDNDCAEPFSFAVIGDYPYSEAQQKEMPKVVDQINADPDLAIIAHLGDIKSEGACSTAYYRQIKAQFDRFADPLVYTFGDNEWTDCFRPSSGRGYNPLERLDTIRGIFVAKAGRTLGKSEPVTSQAKEGFPENVRYDRANVSFATFHAVGPRNGLAPWPGQTGPTAAQAAEVRERTAAANEHIRATFDTAREKRNRAVVLMTQADMFAPSFRVTADARPYSTIVSTIAEEAADFSGPVYLFNGDSHEYVSEQPLAKGSKWLTTYDVPAVENLTRITIDGDRNHTNYLKVTIRPYFTKVLAYTRVPFIGQ